MEISSWDLDGPDPVYAPPPNKHTHTEENKNLNLSSLSWKQYCWNKNMYHENKDAITYLIPFNQGENIRRNQWGFHVLE